MVSLAFIIGSTSTDSIDSSNPLFLYPSYIPGISLVHTLYFCSGFGGLKRSVIVSLSAKNKIAIIDGSCPKPTDNSLNLKQWNRCNNIIISWLTSSLSPEIAESGALDIASYFNKLIKLWDELRVMRSNKVNARACLIKAGLLREEEEDRVHQFPMGLNEIYVGVRNNILMMQYNQSVSFDQNKGGMVNLFCKYCNKHGDLIDKCCKLHDFPPNFKFIKGKRVAARVATENESSNGFTSHPSGLTPSSITVVVENHDHQGSAMPGLTQQ
ncbi:uncharacterized protein [Nicotiana sylvestris]|uniref:uncharacterized protein n=1 Tax=Nicotiana sylvestris TaxID=4096 RepID=UPI00388CAE31